jgi:chromosome segregation ATPase
MKKEKNNLLNKISERYDSHLIDNKNTINRLSNELNQIKFNIQNKDALIEQLKKQIDELNNLIVQSEEDMKLFEENKQEEFKEYTNQIEILMEEKNILTAQNIELTNNLALANENMKQLNEIIIDKYADVEAELYKQTNINENMEKKYKNVLKHMKDKQNCLNQENIKLKEIINNEQDEIDENYRENEVKINDIQNSNLINKMNTSNNNYSMLNFESQVGTNRSLNNNNKSNLININENSEQTFRNNNMNIKNNYNYNINSSYIDTKEAGQKRTLDNFRMLLDKMDKKIN